MPQDAFTLRVLSKELDYILAGGKINRIIQPQNERVEFTVYNKKNYRLLIDVNPSCPRIGITETSGESPVTAPNFCMLLRKHLINATVRKIEIVGYDRIVKITFTDGSEFSDGGEKTLYAELMGRYSNLILTENGKVLGGNRGINFFDNGVRPLIVGLSYKLPPSQNKKEPCDESLKNLFDGKIPEELADLTVNSVQGVSLSTAKEIVLRYKESGEKDFYGFLRSFLYSDFKNPCVSEENGEVKDVFVFPYKTVKESVIPFKTLYAAEDYYFSKREKSKLFSQKKNALSSTVSALLKKRRKKLSALRQKSKDAEGLEENKLKGELILANIYKLKGRESLIEAENYYDGSVVKIPLDPSKTPSENAAVYYKKYEKQKRTLKMLAPIIEEEEREAEYLTSVLEEISLAEDTDDLFCVKEELLSLKIIKDDSPQKKKKEEKSQRTYIIGGFTVKCGKNNVENDIITRSAKKDDLWLHAKDYHSSHLVIENKGGDIPIDVITVAAEICAYYSGGRNGGKTEIVYTQKKNVKKPPKAKSGFFIYERYSSVTVKPDKHEELIKR